MNNIKQLLVYLSCFVVILMYLGVIRGSISKYINLAVGTDRYSIYSIYIWIGVYI